MPKRQTNTSEKLLEFGLGVLSQEGLSGITLGRLAQHAGISKSGVFAHFSSKAEVEIALLEYAGKFSTPHVLEPTFLVPAGIARVNALIHNWFGWAPRAGLPGGCPVAAAMFELDDVEGPVRDKVLQLEADWRGVLGSIVSEAVQLGELRAELDVEQFVFELCGIYLSHHVSSRFVRHPQADERAQTAVNALLERALPNAH
jgi:AcrR family transcriptional regulator